MKNFGNWFWGTIIVVAVFAIGGGFFGGQSIGRAGAMPAKMQVPDIAPVPVQRALVGARGMNGKLDAYQAAIDAAVVDRPDGWAAGTAPAESDPVRLAIIVTGMGIDDTLDKSFVQIPYALTFGVAATGEPPSQVLRGDSRALVIDTEGARSVDAVWNRLQQQRAGGVLTPLAGHPPRPDPLVRRLRGSGAFLIDGMADGASKYYAAARDDSVPAASRDIVIDAYDEEGYVAYMLHEAVRLARRTGVAIVVAHATPDTFEALRKNLGRLVTDNSVQIVPVGELVR